MGIEGISMELEGVALGSKCEKEGIATGANGNVMRAKVIALIAVGIAMGSEEVALGAEGIAIT